MAAATAVVEKYNEYSDELSVSCEPNALVLFNPVIDNGPGGYGFERIGNEYLYFSPLNNLKKGAPPTLMFLGTEDPLVPVATAQYYQKVMERIGSECRLHLYNREGHGFFNYQNFENYTHTVRKTDEHMHIFFAVGREKGVLEVGNQKLDLAIRTSRIFKKWDGVWKQMRHHGSIEDPSLLATYQELVLS